MATLSRQFFILIEKFPYSLFSRTQDMIIFGCRDTKTALIQMDVPVKIKEIMEWEEVGGRINILVKYEPDPKNKLM